MITRLLKKSRRDECFQPAASVAGKEINQTASPIGTTAYQQGPKSFFRQPAGRHLKNIISPTQVRRTATSVTHACRRSQVRKTGIFVAHGQQKPRLARDLRIRFTPNAIANRVTVV